MPSFFPYPLLIFQSQLEEQMVWKKNKQTSKTATKQNPGLFQRHSFLSVGKLSFWASRCRLPVTALLQDATLKYLEQNPNSSPCPVEVTLCSLVLSPCNLHFTLTLTLWPMLFLPHCFLISSQDTPEPHSPQGLCT